MKKRSVISRLFSVIVTLAALFAVTGTAASVPLTTLRIVPAPVCASLNEIVQATVRIEDVVDLWAYHVEMTFTPGDLEVLSVSNGSFLQDGITLENIDNNEGRFYFVNTQVGGEVPPASGSGDLVIITLKVLKDVAASPVTFYTNDSDDSDQTSATSLVKANTYTPIPYQAINAVVTTGECGENSIYLPVIFR